MSAHRGWAPASLSNPGPAIDSVALSFGPWGVTAEHDPAGSSALAVSVDGGDPVALPDDAPLARAIAVVARGVGTPRVGALTLRADMPIGVGLGGSAALLAAAAHALAGDDVDEGRRVGAVADAERLLWGHPSTHVAAAAILGRSVVCGTHYPARTTPLHLSSSIAFAAVVPSLAWGRERWKAAVPRQVPGLKALEQAGRVAGLVVALQSGDLDLLAASCHDRLVLPGLISGIAGWHPAEAAAREAGAAAVWVTGRGPTLALAAASPHAAQAAAAAAALAWRAHAVPCTVLSGASHAEEA